MESAVNSGVRDALLYLESQSIPEQSIYLLSTFNSQ